MDGQALTDRLHHLLLALAGRIDDDASAAARELVAVAEPERAVELLVGCLLAGRIPVTSGEKYQLRQLLDATRSAAALADRLTVIDELPADPHRFHDRDEPANGLHEALALVVDRLAGVRSVRATWRVTPAGATPGAVPRRVVLVELDRNAHPAAVGYQVASALRAGETRAAVEVYRTGDELPDYHRKALAAAMPVRLETAPAEEAPKPTRFRSLVPVGEAPKSVVEEAAAIEVSPEPADDQRAEAPDGPQDEAVEPPTDDEAAVDVSPVVAEGGSATTGDNPVRLPAAVDAKLTDRERNLLARLHEELAQRERGGRRESGKWQLARPAGEALTAADPAPGVTTWSAGPPVPAPNGYPHLSGGTSAFPPNG
ncbi:hypothetical protein [Streptoalloteichus hindustanus]|uniref:Uncharacterized protein n=1 Tax=Streptoalloteichus hindustanus TaxID=2017 RepID=A0A1M4VS91_STRHI|nr:hypothetical protein [Streptoalloteichus hindustanus]SHE71914.1 hypothetical protein SAMN05444320_101873 [Streptoalloteichus hindustanus]